MKKTIYTLVLIIITAACFKDLDLNKVVHYVNFNLDFSESFSIPSTTLVDLPINIQSPAIETNTSSTLESYNTSEDKIEKVTLQKVYLKFKEPENGNFNFLASIAIYLASDSSNETKVAWLDNIPSGQDSITLDIDTSDLKSILLEDQIHFRLQTVTDEIITSDHEIELHSNFKVKAQVLGS